MTGQAKTATKIIGHEPILAFLEHSANAGRLAHAYLFAGPEHVGKMAVAREFTHSLFPGVADLATHPDFAVIERERDAKTGKLHGSIILEQIHALTGRLSLGAFIGGYKDCIIDGAETMTTEAANSLLKTLEEPRPKTILILLANSEAEVLPTIRSRCQIIRVGRVSTEAIVSALVARGVTQGKALLYAGLSGGLPGKAIAYSENPNSLDEMFALRDTVLGFSRLPVAQRWSAIDKLLPAKMPFQEAGDKARLVIDLVAEIVRDALLVASGVSASPTHTDLAVILSSWASEVGQAKLANIADLTCSSRKLLDSNVNPRTVLERLALSF